MTMCGYEGSTAQETANKKIMTFVSLGAAPVSSVTTTVAPSSTETATSVSTTTASVQSTGLTSTASSTESTEI